jgi:hypothetical protein
VRAQSVRSLPGRHCGGGAEWGHPNELRSIPVQKIRSLELAASLLASVVTGTVVVQLIQPAPTLAEVSPHTPTD